MKKEFLSMPFVLGIGVMVLAVVIAAAVAVAIPCNGTVPTNKMSENDACHFGWGTCSAMATSPNDCPAIVPRIIEGNFPTERHFGMSIVGASEGYWIRADWGGTVLCGAEYYCYWGPTETGRYTCLMGDPVRDANGMLIEVHVDYYISIGCDPVV